MKRCLQVLSSAPASFKDSRDGVFTPAKSTSYSKEEGEMMQATSQVDKDDMPNVSKSQTGEMGHRE